MDRKKKKLIIFGFLSLGLLISLLAFYILFKGRNDDNVVNVDQDGGNAEENNIQGRIIKKIGYRPYFTEDENDSPLHFSSAFLVDVAVSVFVTVFITVALIKTEKFEKALRVIESWLRSKAKEKDKIKTAGYSSLISATKYHIILLLVVYLLSFFFIYPSFFILLSLYRKISSLSAYNYLKQLVKKNKILVCLYSILGLVLSFTIGCLCLYLKAKKNVMDNEVNNNIKNISEIINVPDNKEAMPLPLGDGGEENHDVSQLDISFGGGQPQGGQP